MAQVTCAFEVLAGLIPERPMEEYTKRWYLSREGKTDKEFAKECRKAQKEAYEHAQIATNPGILNWVRVDWVWF